VKKALYALLCGVFVALIGVTLILCLQHAFGLDVSYTATLESPSQVYDGDTLKDVRVLIHGHDFLPEEYGSPWIGVYITERGIEIETDIRINGIDTPEKRPLTRKADGSLRSEESRQREKDASLAAQQALIDLLLTTNYQFEVSNPILGKYAGRIVADVSVADTDVGSYLIEKGHARSYDGGRKPDWGWEK